MGKDIKVDAVMVDDQLLVEVWKDGENAKYGHDIYRLVDSASGKFLGKVHYHPASSRTSYKHWWTADLSTMHFATRDEAIRVQAQRSAHRQSIS